MVSDPRFGMTVKTDSGRLGYIVDYYPTPTLQWWILVRFDYVSLPDWFPAFGVEQVVPQEKAQYEDQLKRQQHADKYL